MKQLKWGINSYSVSYKVTLKSLELPRHDMDNTWHPGRATNMTKLVGRQQDLGMTSQIMRMTKEDLVVLTFSLTHLFPLILKIV